MDTLFHTLPAGDADKLNVIVENPKGAYGKFEMDKETGAIVVDRVSYAPMPFPVEYGMIPQTWNKYDNDPLDAMIWSTFPTYPGIVYPARIIGMLEMDDTGELDHKILCLPHEDIRFDYIKSLAEFPEAWLKQIEFFWSNYKKLQPEKNVKLLGWKGRDEAVTFLEESKREFKTKFGK